MAGSLEHEVDNVKEKYGRSVRVIKNVGDYKYILTVKMENPEAKIKFQLTEIYPKTPAVIIINCNQLSEFDINHLTTQLNNTKNVKLCECIEMAQNLIKKFNTGVDMTAFGCDLVEGSKEKRNKKGKRKKKKFDEQIEKEATECVMEKKCSMKTAVDVINRILWDNDLPTEEFCVGYEDRFLGMMEKPFTAFSWEDIASVDYDVLAVPKHRIHYFKYKNLKVWDKDIRLDNMFGSTGSGITIQEAMASYDEEMKKQNETPQANNSSSEDSYDSDDSDDDDGIQVTLNVNQSKLSAANAAEGWDLDYDDDDEDASNTFWTDKLRPNHFIGVRINDPEILQMVGYIQDIIQDNERRYEECCVPPSSLHITLCTLGLDTPDQISNAVRCLRDAEDELRNYLSKQIKLKLDRLSCFFGRVLYANVECDELFHELVNHVKLIMRSSGIEIRDNHDFVPHMTIMKVNRPVARILGTKNISPYVYRGAEETYFGVQLVNNIHICSMSNSRRSDGFYLTPYSLDISAEYQ